MVKTTMCTKESFLSWSESDLKNNSMKYEKSQKLTFEISFWVKKGKFVIFKCVLSPLKVFLCEKNMLQEEFIKLDRVRFQKNCF